MLVNIVPVVQVLKGRKHDNTLLAIPKKNDFFAKVMIEIIFFLALFSGLFKF